MGIQSNDVAHPSEAELAAFAVGSLAELQAAIIERHVTTCERCAAAVAQSPHDDFIALLTDAERSRGTLASHSAPEETRTAFNPAPQVDAPRQLPAALRDHDRYRVIRWLAEGGMGDVYLAEHRLLRSPVAIKTIKARRAEDRKSVERFLQEAKIAARLDHPHIAHVLDAEQIDDLILLAMEYVPGKSLAQIVMKKGPLPVEVACRYISQAADGLEHAAGRGVVHRDIKPQNLMVALPQRTIKILDFGLGRLLDDERSQGRLTADEDVLGTPHFIAPEQIRDSRTADVRSDIYGLGCTFYYLLAAEAPFRGANAIELLDKHASERPPLIRSLRHDVPREVAELIDRMLAKDPRDRPQSPTEVAQVLARHVAPHRTGTLSPAGPSGPSGTAERPGSRRRLPAWSRALNSPVLCLPLITIVLTLVVLILW